MLLKSSFVFLKKYYQIIGLFLQKLMPYFYKISCIIVKQTKFDDGITSSNDIASKYL